MNILIDGQVLETGEIRRGIGVYFRNVLENMIRYNAGDLWYVTCSKYYNDEVLDEWVRKQIVFIKDDVFKPSTDYSTEGEYTEKINEVIREYQIDLVWFPDPMMVNVLFPSRKLACKAVITMYDLIPYVMPVKEWPDFVKNEYLRRINYLKENDIYALSISEATDKDYRKIVGDNVKSKVTFLAAEGDLFYGAKPARKEKDYILFTGGFDYRKNIGKAIEAYGLALKKYKESSISDSYFYIVCKCDEDKKREILASLDEDVAERVKFTGYISDEELAGMYAGARVFFFPSLYEGFGLPILEAMYAGAYVLSADNSSLPEVCNDMADLCDAQNVEDMADKLAKAFDKAGCESEEDRNKRIEYARTYTWEKTARKTYDYFIEIWSGGINDKRYKIGIVTPYPNLETGISNYAINVLPHLKKYFDVDIFVEDPDGVVVQDGIFDIYDLYDLPNKYNEYDEIIYHIGNNVQFHKNAVKMLTQYKGIAEIHDYDLSAFFYNSFFVDGDKQIMRDALRLGYGYEALDYIDEVEEQRRVFDGRYKMPEGLAAYSDAVIFHNKWSAHECKSYCKKYVIPHPCFVYDDIEEDAVEEVKKRINYKDSETVIGLFGFLNRNKRPDLLVKAFKKLKNDNIKLVFWGKDPNGDVEKLIKQEKLEDKAYIMGYMDNREYRAGLKITDIYVNMRFPSVGESSGTLCEAFTMSKPIVCPGINQYLEFPDDICWKLGGNPENEEKEIYLLYRMLEELIAHPEIREAMGRNGNEFAKNILSCEKMAEKYYYAIKEVIEAKKK